MKILLLTELLRLLNSLPKGEPMISKKQLDYRLSEVEVKLMAIEEDMLKLMKPKKGAKKSERKISK